MHACINPWLLKLIQPAPPWPQVSETDPHRHLIPWLMELIYKKDLCLLLNHRHYQLLYFISILLSLPHLTARWPIIHSIWNSFFQLLNWITGAIDGTYWLFLSTVAYVPFSTADKVFVWLLSQLYCSAHHRLTYHRLILINTNVYSNVLCPNIRLTCSN